MNEFDKKKHWETIYQNKNVNEVSWYQPTPTTSLDFVEQCNLSKSAKIIDIGGGDSFFVDHLLDLGYTNITVLDISNQAIEKAKQRLGDKAEKVDWIVADASNFQPSNSYDFWHDRAAFHFLTKDSEIENYLNTVKAHVEPGGYLIMGTFSKEGPFKCSGIEIKQYSEQSMTDRFVGDFEKIKCVNVEHKTPFDTLQNFLFCSFRRLELS
jgi:ubiquinone/menaquinone biosynthesis C-methylase UbiE